MSLGQRVDKVLARLSLTQNVSARDYSRTPINLGEGGHGAHGDPSRKPSGNARPDAEVWAERISRVVDAAEKWVDEYFVGGKAPLSGDTQRSAPKSASKAAQLKQRMRDYEGHDPVYVAFFEVASVEMVRRVRREMGLDVVTGCQLRRDERPILAQPHETLRQLQDVIGGEL